jgi:hypothetical protein
MLKNKRLFVWIQTGGRAISRQFYKWIQGYDCKFQIIADWFNYFEKSKLKTQKK